MLLEKSAKCAQREYRAFADFMWSGFLRGTKEIGQGRQGDTDRDMAWQGMEHRDRDKTYTSKVRFIKPILGEKNIKTDRQQERKTKIVTE